MADKATGLTAPSGLNHLVLNVRNMDESHAFWTEVVGLKQVGKLKARLEQNADDHEARFELATALFGAGDREAAIDELLTLFKRDRKWDEEAARRQLVKFFEVMGPTDPLTLSARRRLSSLMFS